jgi:transcription initiation factor TFIIB
LTSHSRKLWKILKCPECGSGYSIEDYELGEIICQNCGLVINENIMDRGPEWRAFTAEEKESRGRAGIPISYSMRDKGLSTIIDQISRDAHGKQLPISTRLEMQRLRKLQIRTGTNSSIDRNLVQAMGELDRLKDKLRIPLHVKEKAAIIYRKALDNGLVRGRSIPAIASAALYVACRITETPRTLKEVASASSTKRMRNVASSYRLLLRELDIKIPVEDPLRCISKIGSKMEIPIKTQRTAMQLLGEAKQRRAVSGKDPMGLAAATLYVACVLDGVKRTQKELAKVANVTEVTVRNRYKGLKETLKLNI